MVGNDSCNANGACYFAGFASGSANIGSNACNSYEACYDVGGSAGNSAEIGKDACNGYQACYDAAYGTGTITIGAGSCNGYESCYEAAYEGNAAIDKGSCIGYEACYNAGYNGGAIIGAGACLGDYACYDAGYEGTVEIAPAIGYADVICDVVSSGLTLSDNRLKMISGGKILASQSVLIANKKSLENNPDAMRIARTLIELFEAYLIAKDKFALFANMRGESPASIADKMFNGTTIQGLQGPTISQVIVKNDTQNWYAVNIVVSKSELFKAISELREIGGSGVIVVPVNYIFDEEPPRYRKLLDKLQQNEIVFPN